MESSKIAICVFASAVWVSFGLFHILSIVEALGWQFLTPGGIATGYTAVMFGLTLIASLVAFFAPWGGKKTYIQLYELGAEYRYVVWPVSIMGFVAVVTNVFFFWFVERATGFSTRPLYSVPFIPGSLISKWVAVNLYSAMSNGWVFLCGFKAVYTLYSVVNGKAQTFKQGHAMYITSDTVAPSSRRIKTN